MSLAERLSSDLKDAMRAGDALRRDTLRMVLAAAKNRRIELGRELTDEDVLAVLSTAVKSRQDSAEQFDKGGRPELAKKERAEIAVVKGYLPELLGEDATRELVQAAIAETGAADKKAMGAVIKHVMAANKGRADGKLVQRIAAELLA